MSSFCPSPAVLLEVSSAAAITAISISSSASANERRHLEHNTEAFVFLNRFLSWINRRFFSSNFASFRSKASSCNCSSFFTSIRSCVRCLQLSKWVRQSVRRRPQAWGGYIKQFMYTYRVRLKTEICKFDSMALFAWQLFA